MDSVIYLSAQHIAVFYLWQVYVICINLHEKNIRKENIHVLLVKFKNSKISQDEFDLIKGIEHYASVFIYRDSRPNFLYSSSIRPHIIAKHFKRYPGLIASRIFYHDCDILFREIPPFFETVNDDVWYVSDTANYLDSTYIINKIGENNFKMMCNIVGVSSDSVINQDRNCGGAQYFIKGANHKFWEKVEKDSELIYAFLKEITWQNNVSIVIGNSNIHFTEGIQRWCSDMWAVLWNSIFFNYETKVHDELSFSWPKDDISRWHKHYIYHNAGVQRTKNDFLFYKANYRSVSPFYDLFNFVDTKKCSFEYTKAIANAPDLKNRIEATSFCFVLYIENNNEDIFDNVRLSSNYIRKNFKTTLFIVLAENVTHLKPHIESTDIFAFSKVEFLYFLKKTNLIPENIILYNYNFIIPLADLKRMLSSPHPDSSHFELTNNKYYEIDILAKSIFKTRLDDKIFIKNLNKFKQIIKKDNTVLIRYSKKLCIDFDLQITRLYSSSPYNENSDMNIFFSNKNTLFPVAL